MRNYSSSIKWFTLLALFSSTSLLAHDQTSSEGLNEALTAIHHALEGHDHDHDHQSLHFREFIHTLSQKETWKEWKEGLNFKRHSENAYRAYLIASQIPSVREHALNLAFLFPLSHMVETLSGPIMSTLSASAGLPESITYGLGLIGAVFAMPGVDPICLLIFTSYPLPVVHQTVTFLRTKTTDGLVYFGQALGLNEVLTSFWKQRETFPQLLRIGSELGAEIQWVRQEGQNFIFEIRSQHGHLLLAEIKVHRAQPAYDQDSGSTYIDEIKIFHPGFLYRNELQELLKSFGWNLSQVTVQMFKDWSESSSHGSSQRFYVDQSEFQADEGVLKTQFKPRAIAIPRHTLNTQTRLNHKAQGSCGRTFEDYYWSALASR